MRTLIESLFIGLVSLVAFGCGGGGSKGTNQLSFTVIYDGNGNTSGSAPVDSTKYQAGQSVTVLGNTGNLAKTGDTFAGWNTQADGAGTPYTQGQTFAIASANVTLYAIWTTNLTYTVTYEGNGNTGGSVPVDSTHYQAGQSVTVLGNIGNLAKTGESFVGWNTQANGSGTPYVGGNSFAMGSENVTLYAQWSPLTYTVTYYGNGNTGGTVPVDTANYQEGQTVTILANTGSLVKTGYAFSGWNTQANGSGTPYAGGQTFSMGSANVALYAQWRQAYAVIYEGNHNTAGTVPPTIYYVPGQTVTVLGNTGGLGNAPFAFVSWNTQQDGSGASYLPNATFTMGTLPVILYAQWNCITYYSDNWSELSGCNIEFHVQDTPPGIATPNGDCVLYVPGYGTGWPGISTSHWGTLDLFEGGSLLWNSPGDTDDYGTAFWVFQSDGNLVFYDPTGSPIWASNTSGYPGATLAIGGCVYSAAVNGCCIGIAAPGHPDLFLAPPNK